MTARRIAARRAMLRAMLASLDAAPRRVRRPAPRAMVRTQDATDARAQL